MARPILGIVSPKEWLSRTSVLIGARSAALRKADAAYNDYYNLRSDANKQALYQALHLYLLGKGGNWENVPRDKNSGGLMAYIYNTSKPPMPLNILARRVPEARHGVLYLWQHAEVQTHWAKIALEGALGVGTAGISVAQASSYTSADKLHKLGAIAQGSKADRVATGLSVANVGRGVVLAPRGSAKGNAPLVVEPHPLFIKLHDLRTNPSTMEKAKHWLGTKFDEFCDWVRRHVLDIWHDLQLKWHSGQFVAPAGAAITALVNFIVGKVAAHAAPIVGSSIAVVQGFAQAFKAAKERVSAAWQKRMFFITPGHPQQIADAIETQMDWEIGKGIYAMAKGGVLLVADLHSFGATAIIDVLAACVEFAYKVCTRYFQAGSMNAWVKEVQAVTRDRNAWKADPLDGKWRPSTVYNDREFNHLFENGCNSSVCVPMMTLNSGITGDLMMFMKMFDDTGSILGQSTDASLHGPSAEAQTKFNAAQEYWSHLKARGRDYLESTGFEFTSSDKDVRGYMHHAIEHHQRISSFTDRALTLAAAA